MIGFYIFYQRKPQTFSWQALEEIFQVAIVVVWFCLRQQLPLLLSSAANGAENTQNCNLCLLLLKDVKNITWWSIRSPQWNNLWFCQFNLLGGWPNEADQNCIYWIPKRLKRKPDEIHQKWTECSRKAHLRAVCLLPMFLEKQPDETHPGVFLEAHLRAVLPPATTACPC